MNYNKKLFNEACNELVESCSACALLLHYEVQKEELDCKKNIIQRLYRTGVMPREDYIRQITVLEMKTDDIHYKSKLIMAFTTGEKNNDDE